MPLLDELRGATTPIEIKRGQAVFTLDAALEKFTPDEGDYARFLSEEVELRTAQDLLTRQLAEVVSDLQAIGSLERLANEMKAAKVAQRRVAANAAPTAKEKQAILKKKLVISDDELKTEFEKRLHALEAQARALREDREKNTLALKRNKAHQVAYLVAGSDINNADGTPCLSGAVEKTPEQLEADADVFYKNFSPALLDHCLRKVEEAVFAPLEIAIG